MGTYSGRDGVISGSHFVGEVVDLSAGVAENNSLSDVQGVVQVTEGIQFPLLTVHGDVELFDTFKGKLISLDEDANGRVHETLGDLKSLLGHGGREKTNL